MRLIETAQAELVRKLRSFENPLPILPANEVDRVLTYFWWDNFDVKKETIQGSLHTTHGIAFQEKSPTNLDRNTDIEIPRSNKKSITYQPLQLSQGKIVPHKNPQLFDAAVNQEYNGHFADDVILVWNAKRRILSKSLQSVSRFVGWVVKSFGVQDSNTTNITFLPPIFNPITEYRTVLECIKQSQQLASVSQMKYTHITVDAGAAQKFFHVIWNNPEEFRNVIIHLGDFHAMMGFFGNIGKLVSRSGFEDVVYQSNLCTSGGITGVISGKHYNRSWDVHECFAEAVDRLFCEEHLPEISQELEETIKSDGEVTRILQDAEFNNYIKQYNSLQERCIQGEFGKTPMFWMFYKICVERQHKLHFSINTNDFDLRLHMWKESLPLSFAMNKQNYARYGSYYCKQLENMERIYPGAKDELQQRGLAVFRNKMNIGQSIDGAGEQTFMRSSKTTGKASPI